MVKVGCEPRLDYSGCPQPYLDACPVFYLVCLLLQATVLLTSSVALLKHWLTALWQPVAPHEPCSWAVKLKVGLGTLKKDTVLQMRIGTTAYSLAAVVHHACLLQPEPSLPHLVIEYTYNLYNTFLVATIATTLRYWQEFCAKAASSSGHCGPRLGRLDRALACLWSWWGCSLFVITTLTFCFITDTYALFSNCVTRWRRAVSMQHFFFMGICFLIAMSNLRIGYVQERFVSRALKGAMSSVVAGDEHSRRDLKIYRIFFRLAVLGNGLIWIACFNACGIGGILFDTFYKLAFWISLFGLFNAVGLLFALICLALSLPVTREAELRLHDLLAYSLASRRSSERRESAVVELPKRARSPRCRAKHGQATGDLMSECLHSPYPCYVMSLKNLRRYSRLPKHEDALRDGTLRVLTKTSYWPCRSYTYFVSQVWIDPCHPDGLQERGNPKLKWIQEKAPELLGGEHMVDDIFLWMDIFSIPQRSKIHQELGILSLPSYAALAGGFIPLVPEPSARDHYQRRGWCMVECICALTPKLTQRGGWRMGPHPSNLRYFYYSDPGAGQEPELPFGGNTVSIGSLRDPQNPRETDFTVESDRKVVRRIQTVCARLMMLYLQSGSECWDHTCNLPDRPSWLKALLDEDGHSVPSSPFASPSKASREIAAMEMSADAEEVLETFDEALRMVLPGPRGSVTGPVPVVKRDSRASRSASNRTAGTELESVQEMDETDTPPSCELARLSEEEVRLQVVEGKGLAVVRPDLHSDRVCHPSWPLKCFDENLHTIATEPGSSSPPQSSPRSPLDLPDIDCGGTVAMAVAAEHGEKGTLLQACLDGMDEELGLPRGDAEACPYVWDIPNSEEEEEECSPAYGNPSSCSQALSCGWPDQTDWPDQSHDMMWLTLDKEGVVEI